MQDGADEFGFGEEIGGRLGNEESVRWKANRVEVGSCGYWMRSRPGSVYLDIYMQ